MVIDELRKQNPYAIPLDLASDDPDRPRIATANPPDQNPSPPELLASKEEMAFLQSELEQLAPRDRLIMQMRFGDGLSGEEVARMLGISRNAVDQTVHRVKQRLKQKAHEAGID